MAVHGDYFFTIGAPVRAEQRAAGAESTPGRRAGSILWAGFVPGRRVLAAQTTHDPARAAPALPLSIHVTQDGVLLRNTTRVQVATFSADAPRPPLLAYLDRLRTAVARGRAPQTASVPVTSQPVAERITVVAPLHVSGMIGARPVDLALRSAARIRATGRIDLRVEPVEEVDPGDVAGLDGRGLLRAAIRATLTLARARQYDRYLGNPDPAGRSETTYAYRTAPRPRVTAAPDVARHGRSWQRVALVAAVTGAVVLAAVVWARS